MVKRTVEIVDTNSVEGPFDFILVLADSTKFEVLESPNYSRTSGTVSAKTYSRGDMLFGTFNRIKLATATSRVAATQYLEFAP